MAEILGQGLIQVDSDANLQGFKAMFSAMRQVSTETGKAVKATMNFNKGTAKVVVGLDQMSRASDKASTSTAGFSDSLFQTSFALTAVSTSMGLVIRQVGEIGFDFNRNMALVKAVTGSTGSEFEALSGLARDMGRQTEYGAAKAAEGLLVLSRMGLNAANSMKVLGPAIQLAQSQQHDLKESTELVVQQLKVFGKTVDESSRFSNVLAATSSKTAADLEKLNIALGFAGPVAASTGRNFEELNATLGLMFNAGQRASRAGTSLRFGLAALMGTTNAAEKALKKIGLTIKDVDPATNSLSDIFTKLADKLRGVENKAAVFFDIFGKRAATSMGAVVEQVIRNRDAFDELQRSITGTSEAERQFKTQLESVSGQLLILKSELQETFVGLFESVGQEILIVVGGLKQLLNIFQSLPSWMKEVSVIFGALVTAAAAIGASVAGLAFAFKNLSAVSNAMGASLSKPFITMRANMKATQAAIAAMSAQMKFLNAGFIKMDLRRQKAFAISKEASQRIALLVQERMATEKNTAAKLRAARAAIAEGVAIETGNKSIQRAVLRKMELWRVTEMGSKSFGNLSRSAISLKGAFSGLFTALGGWVGITTMAVGLLASAFLKLKADAEEAARKQKEMLDAVAASAGELEHKLKTLAKVEEDLSKDSVKNNVTALNALMKEKTTVTKEVQEIQKKLIELNPLLLKTYDLEKGKIEINIKKLEELIALREREAVKSESKSPEAQNEFERFLDNLDKIGKEKGAGAKLGELRRKSDELRAKVAELSDEAEFFTEKVNEQTKEVSKALAQPGLYDMYGGSAEVAKGQLSLYRKEVEKAENKQADYSRQLVVVEDMLDKMRSALLGAKGETKEMAKELVVAGEGAKRARLNLLSLINSVIDFVNKMKDLQEELTFEINFEDKSDIDTKLAKISLDTRTQSKKIQEDLDELARKYNDKMERIAKGKKHSPEQLNQLTSEMNNAISEAHRAQDILAERSKQKLRAVLRDYLREYRKGVDEMLIENRKLSSELKEAFDGSAAAISDKFGVVFDELSLNLRDAIQDIEENFSDIPEVAQEQLNKLYLIQESYGLRLDKLNKERADSEYETVVQAEDVWKRSAKLRNDTFVSFNISYLKQLKDRADRAKVIYSDDVKAYRSAMLEIEEETDKTMKDITDHILRMTSTAISAFGSFADLDFSAMDDFIGGFSGSIGSFATGDPVGGVSGLLGAFSSLKSSFDAMREEERRIAEERADREKELLDYQRDLLSEARSTNKNIADALREILGFGSSMENIGTIIDSVGKDAADRMAAASADYEGAVGNLNVNPNYKDNNELRDILLGIAQGTTVDNPLYGGNPAKGILEEGDIEKGKDYVTRLIDVYAGLVDVMDSNKTIQIPKQTSADEIEYYTRKYGFAGRDYKLSSGSAAEDDITEKGKAFVEFMDKLIGRSSIDLGMGNKIITASHGFFDNSLADIYQAIRGVYLSQEPLQALETLHTDLPKAIADGMDNTELLETLIGVKDVFDEYIDKSVGGFDVVSGKDYLELIKRISASMLTEAGDDKDAQIEAHRFLINGVKETVSEFGKQFTLGELTGDIPELMIDANNKIEELGGIPEKIGDVIEDTLDDFIGNFKSVTDSIASAFNNGYMTFSEAMSSISELRKTIANMPEDMQAGLTNTVDNMEKALLESVNQKRKTAQDKVDTIGSSTEDFISDLDQIDEKFSDIEANWRGMIGDRSDVISEFEEESKKLQAESDKRIKDLEDERTAVIGTFDFDETQNERSKRFAKVRELEKSILDEIVETSNKLQEMEEKRDESLAKIDEKLDELKAKYGSLEELAKKHQEARNERESEFVEYLREESELLTELLGKSIMLGKAFELSKIMSGGDSEGAASTFSEMLGNLLPKSISESFPEMEGRIEELIGRIKEYVVESLKHDISSIQPAPVKVAKAQPVVSSMPDMPTIQAAKGFQGLVRKPTQFTVGENFKPEYVSVTPVSDMKKFMGGMTSRPITNVYISENIDLRGAYGITTDSVAEEVYRKVWAPARRRNLDRFIGVKGRVIR